MASDARIELDKLIRLAEAPGSAIWLSAKLDQLRDARASVLEMERELAQRGLFGEDSDEAAVGARDVQC